MDPLKLLKKNRSRVHGIASWEKVRGTYDTPSHFGVFANQGDHFNFMMKSLKEDIVKVELQRTQPIDAVHPCVPSLCNTSYHATCMCTDSIVSSCIIHIMRAKHATLR